ncbi:hypothetical protein [Hwanghaeella sp.]|uniref:hypothetical protein n=1 Tax=Hwanghaeella sp. TaxID=2605943 RepID=UPI003CCBC105
MTGKPVMMIVPTANGFALMPFDSNLLVSMKGAQSEPHGVRVSRDLDDLCDDIRDVYREKIEGGL